DHEICMAYISAFLSVSDPLAPAIYTLSLHDALPISAEEGHTGKEYMIRGGSLEGIDAAVMIHGFGYDIASHAWVERRSATVRFQDRKSTRLNSSHVSISYAVFCLKKERRDCPQQQAT